MRARSGRANRRAGIAALAILAVGLVSVSVPGPAGAETIGGESLASTRRTVDLLPGARALPEIWADTWILSDATTGEVLAQKGSHVQRPPASTLKMLTALAVMPNTAPEDTTVATERAATIYGARVGLRPGKTYTLDQLWYAVFLPSANDAAIAVAQANGGVKKTVRQMNETAVTLQANDTVAANTSGLDAPGQLSSAYDLSLFARAGLAREDFARYAGTARAEFPNVRGKGSHTIYTTNRLLLHDYEGMIGVKTGYTTRAGRTYVGAARRGDTTLLVSLMGIHEASETAAKKLLNWGFANHDKVTPVGTLVDPATPEELAAAAEAATAAASASAAPTPSQSPSEPVSTDGSPEVGVTATTAASAADPTSPAGTSSAVVWGAGLLAAAAAGASLLAMRQRRRTPADRGRHAA